MQTTNPLFTLPLLSSEKNNEQTPNQKFAEAPKGRICTFLFQTCITVSQEKGPKLQKVVFFKAKRINFKLKKKKKHHKRKTLTQSDMFIIKPTPHD